MWQDPSISPSWTNCVVITLGSFRTKMQRRLIAKRVVRLGGALGINAEGKNEAGVTYNHELVGFARVNNKFFYIAGNGVCRVSFF